MGQTHCIDDGSILRGCAQLPPAWSPLRLFPPPPSTSDILVMIGPPAWLLGVLACAAKARNRPTCGRG